MDTSEIWVTTSNNHKILQLRRILPKRVKPNIYSNYTTYRIKLGPIGIDKLVEKLDEIGVIYSVN